MINFRTLDVLKVSATALFSSCQLTQCNPPKGNQCASTFIGCFIDYAWTKIYFTKFEEMLLLLNYHGQVVYYDLFT